MARAPSPSSSSSSSGTPPPTILAPTKQKTSKSKTKGKAADAGKNEGVDLNWAYAPPPDRVCITEDDVDAGEFDWETLKNDDDLELWLIRVPDAVKPKYLENITVDVPTSSKSGRVCTLARKHTTYDIWSVGEGDDLPVGGEEIKSISCLLPRKGKNGALYPAPKPIARHLVVSAQPIKPTLEVPVVHQNPPRFSYPSEVLKHRYVAFASAATAETRDVAAMDVDVLPTEAAEAAEVPKVESPTKVKDETKPTKGKKRKGDIVDAAETPKKKTKKSKVA